MAGQRDEILSNFLDDLPKDPGAIEKYATTYPELEEELYDLVAFEAVLGDLEPTEDERAGRGQMSPEAARLAARLNAFMDSLEQDRVREEGAFPGILVAARKVGLSVSGLCKRLRLGRTVVTKLDRRLLEPRTIPRSLIHELADVLQRTSEEVAAYLGLPPTLSASASYRAFDLPALEFRYFLSRRPAAPSSQAWRGREPFRAAVHEAPDMTEEDRRYWLERQEE